METRGDIESYSHFPWYASLWEVELMETFYKWLPLQPQRVLYVRFPLGSGINGNVQVNSFVE